LLAALVGAIVMTGREAAEITAQPDPAHSNTGD
jgi:hypothetical protein